ncbi:MAG TPA: VapC toxin family PIN domain ribonuclease [Gammaproteobacteria bacterium]|nr:VapC toxin family PIN domain ribonuclease [Gammaproteobacteria bacterium]
MYLLDTNVVSELRKANSGKADTQVIRWASSVVTPQLYLSAISVLELEIGILRIERRDPTQGAVLRAWLEGQVLIAFAERILPVDLPVARRCAQLHIPDPAAEREALIAATALTHGLILVTRNIADFKATGAALLNPWTESPGS